MEEAWAIGHSTDRAVRTCLDCNKVIRVKAYCCVCLKELLDEEIHEGDGQRLPGGAFYCAECLAKGA